MSQPTTTYHAIKNNLLASQKNKNEFVFNLGKSQYDSCLSELTDEQQQELGILINETRAVIDDNIMHIPVVYLNQEDSDQLELAIAEAKKEDSTHTFDSAKAVMSYLNDCDLSDPECESCQA